MYLSYVGMRVTDLERSLALYSGFFGLREIQRGDNAEAEAVHTSCFRMPFRVNGSS